MKKLLTLFIAALLLFAAACSESAVQPNAAEDPNAQSEANVEQDVIPVVTKAPTAVPSTPEPTPEPTEEPTPEPTATPEPTRVPREGDFAVNFPDYDTGVDADYSYQSDELKIAITVHPTTMRDEAGNRDLAETYYVADIWVRNLNSLRMLFAKGEFYKGSEDGDKLASRENAILAVNGSFCQGMVLCEGKVLQGLRKNKGWNSCAVCLIYKDGTLKTFYLSNEKFDIDQEIENGAWFGWQFGPIVIRDHEEGPGATRYHGMGYKARNILGYYEPGHYAIVTCDCRGDDARGMNEYMMVDLMKSTGVKDAFNLDGGTSAVLVFMGEIINKPVVGNNNGVIVYGRPLMDMFSFGEYDAESGAFQDLSTLTAAKFLGKE